MNSVKKQDLKPRPMDKKGLQKSGAVGIPKVEKRQTTKMIGFALSSGRKRKSDETEKKYEPTPKVVKKTFKQTSTKPLREIPKNLSKPKAEIKRTGSILPSKIQLKDKKEVKETPRSRVPKVLTEKSLNTMTSYSLKKLILEQQETMKNLNKQIQDLKKTVDNLKEENQKLTQVDQKDLKISTEEKIDDHQIKIQDAAPIQEEIAVSTEKMEANQKVEQKESSEQTVEEVKEPVETSNEEDLVAPKEEVSVSSVNEVPIVEETKLISDAKPKVIEEKIEITENVIIPQESIKEVEVEEKKRVEDIIQSIMEENETSDSPIQIIQNLNDQNVENEEFEEPTTIELSKVLNFDEYEDTFKVPKNKTENEGEDIENEGVIASKTPVRKRNFRKKRKSVDNLVE
eukprot:gene12555-6375_t